MTNTREHPDFEVLSDLLDGYLHEQDVAVVSEHLAVCASCAATYDSLAGLVSSASGLPKSVLPPNDLWSDLRRSLEDRKEIVLRTSNSRDGHDVGSTAARRVSGHPWAMARGPG